VNSRFIARLGAATLGMSCVSMSLTAPAALAQQDQSSSTATKAEQACEITGGTLSWGVKESFRSYISGSIANGKWETSDGADYETPNFMWKDPEGEIDPENNTGTVSFAGTVHFTGHDGVLDLTLSNPTIEFEEDGSAALLLDMKSNDMEGEVAVDKKELWVGDVATGSKLTPKNDKLTLKNMKTTLTDSGVEGFADFYESGESLDPLNLDLQFDGCDASSAASDSDEQKATQADSTDAKPSSEANTEAESSVPWLPITVGGIALLVIGFTAGSLIMGRKRKRSAGSKADASNVEEDAESSEP
jgi:hypothetical protein